MSYMGNNRVRANPRGPLAWAICDLCGQLVMHHSLGWQMQWRGTSLQKTGFLRCERCIDIPNQGLRTIIVTADPPPVLNARPPQWVAQEGPQPPVETVQQIIDGD